MHLRFPDIVGRTVFTLAYLVALALAAVPSTAALLAGLGLLAVWVAPMALRRERLGHRRTAAEPGVRAA